MNRKKFFKGAATGLGFAAIGNLSVKVLGFNNISLMIMLYLYVVLGTVPWLTNQLSGLGGVLEKLVLVTEREEMVMKKVFTGEKYRVKGEVEKL